MPGLMLAEGPLPSDGKISAFKDALIRSRATGGVTTATIATTATAEA